MSVLVSYLIIGYVYILSTVNCYPKFQNIAGNLSISECISGGLLSKSDYDITTTKMIKREGYPVEEHVVLTEDGYYLTLHRIPGKSNSTPVFVHHGILCSSFDWVVSGKGKALAFILSDHGYDVWLGNARGNTYSRCHTKYRETQTEYWNFSFHEMATKDLPAVITHIAKTTSKGIIYIGHSMGTTISYILAIERPDIASKLKVLVSLSPVAHLKKAADEYGFTRSFFEGVQMYTNVLGDRNVLKKSFVTQEPYRTLCFGSMLQRRLCANFYFSMFGFDALQCNYTLLPIILSHVPAGTSTKTCNHYRQIARDDRFQNFDYGPQENVKQYGNGIPPDYDLSKVNLPVALLWAQSDMIVHQPDIERLSKELPNVILNHMIELPEFDHLDFMYAKDAFKYLYPKVLSTIDNFR